MITLHKTEIGNAEFSMSSAIDDGLPHLYNFYWNFINLDGTPVINAKGTPKYFVETVTIYKMTSDKESQIFRDITNILAVSGAMTNRKFIGIIRNCANISAHSK